MATRRLELGPVRSADELDACIAEVSSSFSDSLLLFRGQNNLHSTVRSGLARPDVRFEPDVEKGWSAVAGQIFGHGSVSPRNIPFRKAVLQHYGLKTHYVDVTSDARVGAWFASNTYDARTITWVGAPLRRIDQVQYLPRTDGIGYLVVLAIPEPSRMQEGRRLFNITDLEPFVRPTRQRAWLVYDRRPLLPDPNDLWVASIQIDCSRFSSEFTSEYLFPVPSQDPGYRALLDTPFVEIHGDWLGGTEEDVADEER